MRDKRILAEMIEIYKPIKYDWMGFKIDENSILTYHHIVEKRNGGAESIYNGAILTKKAHKLLHSIENIDPDLYAEYAYWFRIINDMGCPPIREVMVVINSLKEIILYDTNNKKEIKKQTLSKELQKSINW